MKNLLFIPFLLMLFIALLLNQPHVNATNIWVSYFFLVLSALPVLLTLVSNKLTK
jgi:hypothetical protein